MDIGKLKLTTIKFTLSEHGQYLDLIENFWDKEKRKIDKQFDALKEEDRDENMLSYEDHLIDEYQTLEKLQGSNFRSSALVQLFSLMEYHLKDLCDFYADRKKKEYKMIDLAGNSDLDKAKKFLSITGKIDFKTLSDWSDIHEMRHIRNIIVHHNNRIMKSTSGWDILLKFRKRGWIDFVEGDPDQKEKDGSPTFKEKHAFTFFLSSPEINRHFLDHVTKFFGQVTTKLPFK